MSRRVVYRTLNFGKGTIPSNTPLFKISDTKPYTSGLVLLSNFNDLTSSFNSFTSSYSTGSFTGSFIGNGSGLTDVTASLAPNYVLTSSYLTDSSSFDTRILSNSSSIDLLSGSFETFTSSYNTGSFSGSFTGDGSQLTGIVSSKWSGSNPITRDSDVEITGSLKLIESSFKFEATQTSGVIIETSGLGLKITSEQGNALEVLGGSNGNNIATFKSDNTEDTLAYISTDGSIFTTGSTSITQNLSVNGSIIKQTKIITGSAYTLQEEDKGRVLHFTNNSDVTITIPTGLTSTNRYEGKQLGDGQLIFGTDVGVDLRVGTSEVAKTAEKYSVFGLDVIGTEEYMLFGKLELS
jgi:hypothetical protein